jgi:hypothetical protein
MKELSGTKKGRGKIDTRLWRQNLYKEIMERERKVWQDKNIYNIKILLKKNDAQEQVWIRKMRLTEVKKVRKEVDPVKSRK